jgi:hypothetical protein
MGKNRGRARRGLTYVAFEKMIFSGEEALKHVGCYLSEKKVRCMLSRMMMERVTY